MAMQLLLFLVAVRLWKMHNLHLLAALFGPRIGPTAGLKTLEIMGREKSWEKIMQIGSKIIEGWECLARKYGLKISIAGLPAMPSFSFVGSNKLIYKTIMTQEMLARGYLASCLVYPCISHTNDVIRDYLIALDSVFSLIRDCQDGRDILSVLKGPVCHDGFKRLN